MNVKKGLILAGAAFTLLATGCATQGSASDYGTNATCCPTPAACSTPSCKGMSSCKAACDTCNTCDTCEAPAPAKKKMKHKHARSAK